MNVIAVVLGADGDAAAKEFDSFADTVTLLDWCFENYSYRSIVERGYPAAAQPIEKDGRRGELTLVCAQEINALAEKALDAATLKKRGHALCGDADGCSGRGHGAWQGHVFRPR